MNTTLLPSPVQDQLLRQLRPKATEDDIALAQSWWSQLTADGVQRATLAIDAAASYSQFRGPNGILVHNRQIAQLLRDSYSVADFEQLMLFCWSQGVFDLSVDQHTGLVCTAGCQENRGMHDRRWLTDALYCLELQRVQYPREARQVLLTLAHFYCTAAEQRDIELTVRDRGYYIRRDGNQEAWLQRGVAHVFFPGPADSPMSLRRDPEWFNNKRLGSHGLALENFCRALIASAMKSNNFNAAQTSTLVDAVASLAIYLWALNTDPDTGYPDYAAPSSGHWEEVPFDDGMTSDIEAMRAGLEALHYLLSAPQLDTNTQIQQIRQRLTQHAHGHWLQDITALERLIAAGADKVRQRLFGGSHPMEHPRRPADSSLFFIPTSTIRFGNVREDAERHFSVLDYAVDHLRRDHGMIRYAPFKLVLPDRNTVDAADGYLGANFWLLPSLRCWTAGMAIDPNGSPDSSKDTSTIEGFLDRQRLMPPGTEAQWCWPSEAAAGYAAKTAQLLAELICRSSISNNSERQLIGHGIARAHDMINRALARITAAGDQVVCKSNGYPCPPFAVPEAYECVSDGKGGFSFVPGVNTPLAWGQASLFAAGQKFLEMLCLLQQARQMGMID